MGGRLSKPMEIGGNKIFYPPECFVVSIKLYKFHWQDFGKEFFKSVDAR